MDDMPNLIHDTINDTVGTEPIPNKGVETSGNYFKEVKQSNALIPLKVIVGCRGKVSVGDVVYVTVQSKTQHWAQDKETVEYEGQKMIFVPLSDIKMIGFDVSE